MATCTPVSLREPATRTRCALRFPALLLIGIGFLAAFLASNKLADPDLWWHLRIAARALTTGHLPHRDFLSFSVRGHAWTDTEWLSELFFYGAWRAGGLAGLQALMTASLVALELGIVGLAWQRARNIKAAAAAGAGALLLATVSFGPRTIIFGYLCTIGLLALLERYRRQRHAPLWLLPLLFALWVNLHGSWALGLALLALFTISGWRAGVWGWLHADAWTPRQRRELLLATLGSCLALLLNPYGLHMLLYPFWVSLREMVAINHVQEWRTINFHLLRGKLLLLLLLGLFLLTLIRRRAWRVSDLLWAGFALYCGLTYERFLVLTAIVVTPMLAERLLTPGTTDGLFCDGQDMKE